MSRLDLSFLVIEDIPDSRNLLVRRLRREFPDATVDAAETVVDALQMIDNKLYDGIVQDLKLPSKKGENPEVDATISQKLQEQECTSFVVYTAAYPEDAEVKLLLAEHCLDAPGQPSPELVSKDVGKEKEPGEDWAADVVESLREFVVSPKVSKPLERRFKLLVASGDEDAGIGNGRSRDKLMSDTQQPRQVYFLLREIENNWRYLDRDFRNRIRKFFEVDVDEADGRVSVGLH